MGVRCEICGKVTDVAMWAKIDTNADRRGWLCRECYDSLWNVLDQNQ